MQTSFSVPACVAVVDAASDELHLPPGESAELKPRCFRLTGTTRKSDTFCGLPNGTNQSLSKASGAA